MTFEINHDFSKLEAQLAEKKTQAQRAFIDQAHQDMNRKVPMQSGELRNRSFIRNDDEIVWDADHAAAVWDMDIQNPSTPGTNGEWGVVAENEHREQWVEVVKRVYNQ